MRFTQSDIIRRTMGAGRNAIDCRAIMDEGKILLVNLSKSAAELADDLFSGLAEPELALLLAAVGLYGILSFTVLRRTREIGVRIAIGAQRRAVLWMIVRDTLALGAIGIALGIPVVLLAKKSIESELFGLRAQDPLAIAAAALVLTVTVLTAGMLPALRASRLDPIAALRQE